MTTPQHHNSPASGAPYGVPAAAPQVPPGYYLPGWPPPGTALQCRMCGASPAVSGSVRGHQGLLIVMRFQSVPGPLCHTCGRAVVRQMSTVTLALGWWSPLSVVALAPITLLTNFLAWRRFTRLPQSAPAPGHQQLPEGTPLYRRWTTYIAVIPLVWATWLITSIITHSS
ncbi:hypothetical protein ACH4VT_33555 [Streptomyces lydicus]|uniref:hypothetical protein n=1 Tax=Streptomyces lydicus TaxID=47763 RepID=UPI0037A568C7